MNIVLGHLKNKVVLYYLDDMLIPAKNWTDMINRLREVFSAMRDAKLTFRLNKCKFGVPEVEYL